MGGHICILGVLLHDDIVMFLLQSLTITQQGFLNAIVYGWTREDFLNLVGLKSSSKQLHDDTELSDSDTEEEEVMEGGEEQTTRKQSTLKEEHSFTRSFVLDTDYSDLEESK